MTSNSVQNLSLVGVPREASRLEETTDRSTEALHNQFSKRITMRKASIEELNRSSVVLDESAVDASAVCPNSNEKLKKSLYFK